ncbi:MAG: hypothetical protein AAB534_01105 [Patescibacteria group bacterium]
MIKNFLMKQLIKSKLKSLPEADRVKVMGILEKDPEFFAKMAESVKQKMATGKDQMTAIMEIAQENKDTIGKLLGK